MYTREPGVAGDEAGSRLPANRLRRMDMVFGTFLLLHLADQMEIGT
jgi:hypothetical protein